MYASQHVHTGTAPVCTLHTVSLHLYIAATT